jgi:hypothetical protein
MRPRTLAVISAAALAVAMPVALTQAAPQPAAAGQATTKKVSPHCACSCTHVNGKLHCWMSGSHPKHPKAASRPRDLRDATMGDSSRSA